MTIIDSLLPHVLYAVGGYLAGVVTAVLLLWRANRRAAADFINQWEQWRRDNIITFPKRRRRA